LIKLKGLNWKGRAIILIIRVIIKRAKYICLSDSFTELIAFVIHLTVKNSNLKITKLMAKHK